MRTMYNFKLIKAIFLNAYLTPIHKKLYSRVLLKVLVSLR